MVNRFRGKTHSTMPTLIKDNEAITDNTHKANTLADHYQNVSSNTGYSEKFLNRKQRIEIQINNTLKNKNEERLDINYNNNFSLFELKQALNACSNSAPGEDQITYEIIKQLPINALEKLLELYNQSWKDSKMPDSWNEAIVIPILKLGKEKTSPSSYRPMSLTPCLTKNMQRMIKPRLVNFLEKENLISENQSGSRPNHSCEDHLTRLESDCRKTQYEGHLLLAIFLDLSNAFDRHWNKGAIWYLNQIGIKGRMLYWLSTFLEGRKIKVKVNNNFSESTDMENGCPQGSVLSPILFCLIMNTLNNKINQFNNKLSPGQNKVNLGQFVDDGAIWLTASNINFLVKKSQNVLNAVEEWAEDWGFTINPTKTQVLLVSGPRQQPLKKLTTPKLTLANKTLEFLDSAKLLGIHFDKYLTWNKQITELINRCNKDINLMRMISGTSYGADKLSLVLLYKSLILSKINYGSIAYSSASTALLNKLQTVQNKALKIATGALRNTKTNNLLIESAEIPLYLKREECMLKYWARTEPLGHTLPVNNHITDTPIYEFYSKKTKQMKLPYTQEVQKLVKK